MTPRAGGRILADDHAEDDMALRTVLVIVAGLCLLAFGEPPAPAAARQRATAPEPLAVPLDDGEEERDAAVAWLKARIANAKAGRREIVRVPLVARSMGWGCRCPAHYLGLDPYGDVLGLGWVAPDPEPGVSVSIVHLSEGDVFLVEGWFTGKTVTEDLRNEDGEPAEWLYRLDELHVARARPLRAGDRQELRVVLPHPAAAEAVPPLADDRPWVVIAGSADLTHPRHAERAAKLAERVRKAGFPDVEVLDSRRLPQLWCCASIVVAGRFRTEAEAKERAAALRKKKLKPTVREGFAAPSPPASGAVP